MKRIRIIHTADIHLDSCFAALGASACEAALLRDAQRRAFLRIIEHAQHWPADALLIAGDLFESGRVEDDTIAFVREAFERLAPTQVYIAPGNRDPYMGDSPYVLEPWPDNVRVFAPGSWQAVAHPAVPLTIHGIGCDGTDDSGDWFKALRLPADERVHVAVAHGTERSHQPPEGKCFAPFDAADIAQERLAYLALGHFHNRTEIQVPVPTLIRYPGTPQGRDFSEQGDRGFFQVEITVETSGPPQLHVGAVSSAQALFHTGLLRCSPGTTAEQLLDGLGPEINDPDHNRAVRIKITGTLDHPMYDALRAIRDEAGRRFLFARIESHSLPVPIYAEMAGGNTCFARLMRMMNDRVADAPDNERATVETAARELALSACYGRKLPKWDETDLLP